jgi:hypothetical protein
MAKIICVYVDNQLDFLPAKPQEASWPEHCIPRIDLPLPEMNVNYGPNEFRMSKDLIKFLKNSLKLLSKDCFISKTLVIFTLSN